MNLSVAIKTKQNKKRKLKTRNNKCCCGERHEFPCTVDRDEN